MVKAENFGQQEIDFRKIIFSVTAKRSIFRKLISEIRLKSIQTHPNIPTNDSFWENNPFMDSEHECDPLNTPTTQSHINPTTDQNANQSEFWMPSKGSNLRLVDVE